MTTMVVIPVARTGKGIMDRKAVRNPRQAKIEEQPRDAHRANQPRFFRHYGINEIGMRFGKVKELLLAFHQADSRQPARADGNQRLGNVKSGSLPGSDQGSRKTVILRARQLRETKGNTWPE